MTTTTTGTTTGVEGGTSRRLRVVVADDERIIRESIAAILDGEDDLEVVGIAGSGQEAVALADTTHPDVVVMDLRMPGLDGLQAITILSDAPEPRPAVLALTTFATDEAALDAIRAGATGFCSKADPAHQLADAVRTVASGDAIVSPRVLRTLLQRLAPRPAAPPATDDLTARETEILRLVAQGATNPEITETLNISTATVRTHITHLRAKLHARTRAELVVRAWEQNLNTPPNQPGPPKPTPSRTDNTKHRPPSEHATNTGRTAGGL
jgi:DNA-binding NarL/FixJ family response regulator